MPARPARPHAARPRSARLRRAIPRARAHPRGAAAVAALVAHRTLNNKLEQTEDSGDDDDARNDDRAEGGRVE
eukprot:6094010-Prymnesium_polylepis.1